MIKSTPLDYLDRRRATQHKLHLVQDLDTENGDDRLALSLCASVQYHDTYFVRDRFVWMILYRNWKLRTNLRVIIECRSLRS